MAVGKRILAPHRFTHALAALCLLVPASDVAAEWGLYSNLAGDHETYVYTPKQKDAEDRPANPSTPPSYGLLVVLHGCDQTHTDLMAHGNLEKAADEMNLVMAVPYVGKDNAVGKGCWDYSLRKPDASSREGSKPTPSKHAIDIIELTKALMKNEEIQRKIGHRLDPKQVYVVGLSSGGALSLVLGCAAPSLYAGIGAIAAPSLGSRQELGVAFADHDTQSDRIDMNVAEVAKLCEDLAGSERAWLKTQVTNLAFGDMDLNGGNARYKYSRWWWRWWTAHPGQYAVVSVAWSKQNMEILKRVYGASDNAASASGGQSQCGFERSATAPEDGRVRVTLKEICGVGHAWPAGAAHDHNYSSWIAPSGFDYPAYITNWLKANNIRLKASKPQR